MIEEVKFGPKIENFAGFVIRESESLSLLRNCGFSDLVCGCGAAILTLSIKSKVSR
jgi:hypothetical protein